MAEFCLDCYNEICLPKGYPKKSKSQVVLSKELELCEGCAEYKRIVVTERRSFFDLLFGA